MFVVKWETLNGNIRTAKFDDGAEAEDFFNRVESRAGTQWVDIDFVGD